MRTFRQLVIDTGAELTRRLVAGLTGLAIGALLEGSRPACEPSKKGGLRRVATAARSH